MMSRNRLSPKIIIGISVAIFLIVGLIIFQATRIPKVNFSTEGNLKFTIYQATPSEFKSVEIATPQSLSLATGDYYASARDQSDYSPEGIKFTVADDLKQAVKLQPSFSQSYWFKKYQADIDTIHQNLMDKYRSIIELYRYSISYGGFYQNGQYYAASIATVTNKQVVGNEYKVVFKHDSDGWKQITHPELILSSVDYPELPEEVSNAVNAWRL